MKIRTLLLLLVCAVVAATAQSPAAAPGASAKVEGPALPAAFSGWQKDAATARSGSDPALADPVDAAVLKEYGFTRVELATYKRDDRALQVKAAQFKDASGAYGAFTYYNKSNMQPEKIGDEAVSYNTRVLFFRGNFLVDVTLERVTAMSAADLRALADMLPKVRGNLAVLPNLPGNLPQRFLIAHTGRYVIGPVALERLGLPVTPTLVDFDKSPELVYADYRTQYGEAHVTLVAYPTPQIAAERLKAMQAAAQSGTMPGAPFRFKRTGPIVALLNGQIPDADADTLLASVNYDAEVTWNQPAKPDPKANSFGLLVAMLTLAGLLLLFGVISGLAFGGFKVLLRRLHPDRTEEAEMIHLDLK